MLGRAAVVGTLRQVRFAYEVLDRPERRPDEDECPDADGFLHLAGVGHFDYRVLGRTTPAGSWRWSEHDETIESGRRQKASGLRRTRGRGDSWFADPGDTPIDPDDAGLIGVVAFGADAYHRIARADGSELVVLVRHELLERQPLPYEQFGPILTWFAESRELDHGELVDGWLDLGGPGLEVDVRPDGGIEVVATGLQGFAVGTTWSIDRLGERIVGVRSSLDDDAGSALPPDVAPPPRGDPWADDPGSGDGGPAVARTDVAPVWSALFARHALTAALRRLRLRFAVLEHPDRAPDREWHLDATDGALVFAGLAPFGAQLVGTAPAPDAWSWAWEEDGVPGATGLRDAHRLRGQLAPLLGDAVDDTAGLDLELVAVVSLGLLDADASYVAGGPTGAGVLVLLHDPRLRDARVPYELLPTVLMSLLGVRAVPHRDLVAGWRASVPAGLVFSDEADGAVLVRAEGLPAAADGAPDPAEGAIWRIEFDEQERITGVRGVLAGR